MNIAVIIVTIALTIYLGGAAIMNIFYLEEARKNGTRLGLSRGLSFFIGLCQLAAVIGFVGGLWCRPLAIAAGIGVLLLMIGAVIAHKRINDPILQTIPAVVVFIVTAFLIYGHVALMR